MLTVYPSIGRDWNHELAGFGHSGGRREPSAGPLRSDWNDLMAKTAVWKHLLAETAEQVPRACKNKTLD
jgi:hypothetical protein